MSILFLLIPLSLILLGVAIWAFFWAVDSNQFDDLSGPAYSILYDDDVKADKKPSAAATKDHQSDVQQSTSADSEDSKQA
ncbi:cbb3-type cytochrome oxidase assembly protein CcoS [Oceanospirillum sanctuarii]|uniref:cbb3-type cytochrome oxidase assembly protein CcoS n=1 Tax=Oceanospirillum sanctuarii TaxID=1434821 RepID=UPI000A3677F8|nr:cbb3-type cytochrome oxidase assembly protein CcoS [Oceanospirillum sanctuarii]